jgi:hypothetical protein
MILSNGTTVAVANGETVPQIGDRISDKSAPPDDSAVRERIGPEAFEHWAEFQNWIAAYYPGVFAPEWLYGGKKRGWSLRYKKSKAFRNTGCFRSWWSWGQQNEKGLKSGAIAGLRIWSSSTMKPEHTLMGNGCKLLSHPRMIGMM